MNFNTNYIGPDELVYNDDGEIHSGGFSVNSIMLKNGLSPILTLNQPNGYNIQDGGNVNSLNKVSDLFNNLVIPNWALSYNYKNGVVYEGGVRNYNDYDHDNEKDNEKDESIDDSLHDKLLNLVKVEESEFTPLKNSIRTADEFSSKLPVTDLYGAPRRGADSNLHGYKKPIHNKKNSKKNFKNSVKTKKNVTKKLQK